MSNNPHMKNPKTIGKERSAEKQIGMIKIQNGVLNVLENYITFQFSSCDDMIKTRIIII